MAPLSLAALALVATAATQASSGENAPPPDTWRNTITTSDDCILLPSATIVSFKPVVPADEQGCQVFDGTGLWQREAGAAAADAIASQQPIVLRRVLDLTDAVLAVPEITFKFSDWSTEGDALEDELAPPIGSARCYEESVGEPPFRNRHLLGAVSYAWADDRDLVKQLDSGLQQFPEELWRQELCVGNKTEDSPRPHLPLQHPWLSDSPRFESHTSRYSIFSPLQENATWSGFPPAQFDAALGLGFAEALPVELALEPGDVLLIPPGWGFTQTGAGEALYTPAQRERGAH